MKDLKHDNLETVPNNPAVTYPPAKNGVRKKTAVAPGVSNKVTGAFEGVQNPYLTNRLQYSHPRMVLTVDNGDAENSTGYWIWDEDGNKFVKYDIPVEAQPLYKCSYCQKSFRGSGALSNHLASHSLGVASVSPKFEKPGTEDVAATQTTALNTPVYSNNLVSTNDMPLESKSFLEDDIDSVKVQSESSDIDNAKGLQKVAATSKFNKNGLNKEGKARRGPKNKRGRSLNGLSTGIPEHKSPVSTPEANEKLPNHSVSEINNEDGEVKLSKAKKNENDIAALSGSDAADKPKAGKDNSASERVPGKTETGSGERRLIPPKSAKERDSSRKGWRVDIPGITEHIEIIRVNAREKHVRCKLCEKVFSSKSSRQNAIRHIKIIHLGEKPFQCPICSEVYSMKQNLEHHMHTHKSGSKPYNCHICSRGFFQKGHLTVHLRVHSGIKPYKCDKCERAYYQRRELIMHQRTHNQIVDVTKVVGEVLTDKDN